ncbi:MAG TPA: PAS domain-containing protein [Longimicrobiales bacterium]|nr:PAS domain-containing protein [Longimicrobiales bacterium]
MSFLQTRPRVRPELRGEVTLRASLLDALGEAVVAADLDGRIIFWNRAAERLFGWSGAEAVGADVTALVAAEGSRAAAIAILRHLRAGEAWAGHFFVRHRDGRSFPIHASTTAVRDGRGVVVATVGLARDLSAERQTEAELQQTREHLALVHRAAATVIWEWEPGSRERRWNDAVADTFGYPPAEVEGTLDWWEERVHPDDRQRVGRGAIDALAEGRRFWTEEYRFRRGDGSYALVFDRAYVAVDDDGRPVRVVGTMLDLTDRHRSHEAARFLEQAGMLLDLSMDFGATLPSLARLATQTVADACLLLVGTVRAAEHVVAVAGPAVPQQALDRVAARLRTSGPAGTLIERVLRSGESVVLPDFSPALLADAELDEDLRAAALEVGLTGLVLAPMTARGQIVGAVLLGRSAGSPRPGEHDLRAAEELGRRIGLAVDNARLFHSAELARRAKTDFLSVMSHELRTPLTAVMGYAELLSAQIAGALNARQRHQVDRIRAGADKLLRVIEGILAYARLESGQERLQVERVPLDLVLQRVRDVVGPQAAAREIRLDEDLSRAPDTVCVDVEKTTHVLIALLANATKFSAKGGRCGLRAALEGDRLVFDVFDTGPGLDVAHLPHLFEPFWQAEQPEVRRVGGSGLGLSVARRLARVMGGEVVVLDTSAGGTTFRVDLPAHANA